MGKNILVPFDGSDASKQAAEFALSLLNEEDKMILMNVQKPQYEGFQKVGNISKDDLDAFYLEEGVKILSLVHDLKGNSMKSIEKIVRIGLPAIEITKAAKEFSVHSIVMGSRGMSPVVNNALGSVTYSVIHLASCPVTVVPYKD